MTLSQTINRNNRDARAHRRVREWSTAAALLFGAAIALAIFIGLTSLFDSIAASITAARDLGELSQIAANGW